MQLQTGSGSAIRHVIDALTSVVPLVAAYTISVPGIAYQTVGTWTLRHWQYQASRSRGGGRWPTLTYASLRSVPGIA
eukprot:330285-Rhodomonas_salina.5